MKCESFLPLHKLVILGPSWWALQRRGVPHPSPILQNATDFLRACTDALPEFSYPSAPYPPTHSIRCRGSRAFRLNHLSEGPGHLYLPAWYVARAGQGICLSRVFPLPFPHWSPRHPCTTPSPGNHESLRARAVWPPARSLQVRAGLCAR